MYCNGQHVVVAVLHQCFELINGQHRISSRKGFRNICFPEWVPEHILPQNGLLKCTMQQIMNVCQYRGRNFRIRLQSAIQRGDHLGAELSLPYTAHDRNKIVPNEPFVAGRWNTPSEYDRTVPHILP